ncbi:methyltransferase domain-containing protein, partial [Candidatus Roizmanbacteria bacterium]|nr:methyltransferase domain-containing protein [Candidatus Roizmanbacteria bacterium]
KMKRFETEADSIARVLDANHVKHVLDVGCGTGAHAIELAQRGFSVTGMEKSDKMTRRFEENIKQLDKSVSNRVKAVFTESYRETLKKMKNNVDAVLFLGNALPQTGKNYRDFLVVSAGKLNKNGVMIIQLTNFDRVINKKRRLQFFDIFTSRAIKDREYALAAFYDEASKNSKELRMNMAILENNGRRWATATINSLPVYNLAYHDVEKELKKLGFSSIQVFGSGWGEPLFVKPYDESQSHWVNIVAVR